MAVVEFFDQNKQNEIEKKILPMNPDLKMRESFRIHQFSVIKRKDNSSLLSTTSSRVSR